MKQQRHSGFAQFPDIQTRERFVRTVLAADADLKNHAYLPGSRPTIVFENLTSDKQRKIVTALEGLGRWVEDVQFETMG
jgi:hypothetical protein